MRASGKSSRGRWFLRLCWSEAQSSAIWKPDGARCCHHRPPRFKGFWEQHTLAQDWTLPPWRDERGCTHFSLQSRLQLLPFSLVVRARLSGLWIQRECGVFVCFETVAPVAQDGLQLATVLNLTLNFWFSFFYLLGTETASVCHHASFYVTLGTNWAQHFVQDRLRTMPHPHLLNIHLCSHWTGLRPIAFLLGTSMNSVLLFLSKACIIADTQWTIRTTHWGRCWKWMWGRYIGKAGWRGLGEPGAVALLPAGLGGVPENGRLGEILDRGQNINLVGPGRSSVIRCD